MALEYAATVRCICMLQPVGVCGSQKPVCNLESAQLSKGVCSKQAFMTHKRHRLQLAITMQQHSSDATPR